MERLLAVAVPELTSDDLGENVTSAFVRLLEELVSICPFVEPVRCGLLTLPLRGPSRFFGGEEIVVDHVRATVRRIVGSDPHLGAADGLFTAVAAARRDQIVPPAACTEFRRSLPVATLERRELTTLCRRLGLHTVGAFADLPPARVAERFSRDAQHAHRVARGEESELRGQRDLRLVPRLRALRGENVATPVQEGFFGDHLGRDRRAEIAAHRVRRRLGPEGVSTAVVLAGRTPQDRATLLPWPPSGEVARPPHAPWPGQIPAPAPATTFVHPLVVRLRDAEGAPVSVDSRGLLSAAPHELSWDTAATREVEWFAGPWPTVERWWSTRRRRAYVQVLTPYEAVLLYAERGQWWLAGLYD